MRCRLCPTERNAGSRKIYQSIADGVDDEFGGLVHSQSIHHIGAMDGNRVRAEIEDCCDFFVRLAFHYHLQDFELTRSESCAALASEGCFALELRVEHSLAGNDAPDGRSQFEVYRVLQNVAPPRPHPALA